MIDQSHNIKGKMEAMVQTVVTARSCILRRRLSIATIWQNCRQKRRP